MSCYDIFDRTTTIIYEYEYKKYDIFGDEHRFVAVIANSSGDYGVGPETDSLIIKHYYPSGAGNILYKQTLVDDSFDKKLYPEIESTVRSLAKLELS